MIGQDPQKILIKHESTYVRVHPRIIQLKYIDKMV